MGFSKSMSDILQKDTTVVLFKMFKGKEFHDDEFLYLNNDGSTALTEHSCR